jgi:branched-subunit amino acid ABC-type transport system permease component
VTISFGMLDIVNIAHPAFITLGSSFVAYIQISGSTRS